MTKVQLAVPARDKARLLQWLQNEEIVHLAPLPIELGAKAAETDTGHLVARAQFGLEFLQRVRRELGKAPKRNWRNVFAGKPAASLDELEATLERLDLEATLARLHSLSDRLAKLTAEKQTLTAEQEELAPWRSLAITGNQLSGTPHASHVLAAINLTGEDRLLEQLKTIPSASWQEVGRVVDKKRGTLYLEIIANRDNEQQLEHALSGASAERVHLPLTPHETVATRLASCEQQLNRTAADYAATLQEAGGLLKLEHDLKLAYDALLHHLEREALATTTASFALTFALAGWIPQKRLKHFETNLLKRFPAAALEKVEPDKEEVPPVSFQNNKFITPFEAVTDIFGKPRYHELDPTPVLSLFFLVAFGLALTDAGYGLVLMLSTAAAQRFFRLKRDMKKMVQLLFYAGFFTLIIGALTGGWFGVTLEELPPSALRDALLSVKLIDPISAPISLLMVAFALGIVQLLFAWAVHAWDLWQKGERSSALLDGVAWITMVLSVLVWAGASRGVLPATWGSLAGYIALANAAVLVLSQGRQHKNLLLRFGAGVLSLYGLVSFLSDVLSYSRLLALGLATGIIGLVVNLLGGMVIEMVPIVGVLLAVIVLIGGHIFNLGINTLGAFIHAGRLQFVEFFPKFMEGGGVPYKPLGRVSKYVDNPNDFI